MAQGYIQKVIEGDEFYTKVNKNDVSVTTESGICILISTLYFTTKKKGKGCKKKRNKGLYPALLLLGIHDRFTPMLISEIGKTVATVGSFEEAKDTLSKRGVIFSSVP